MGRIQLIYSKWTKARLLMKHNNLTKNHPMTKYFTERNLREMINKYKMVFIKPVYGSHGNGVMRLDHKDGMYQYQSGASKRKFSSYASFYKELRMKTKNKPYMVQKGIHLLTYQNCPFDIRVMIQKNASQRWECSGMLCRVAHPSKIITNLVGGGRVMSVEHLLQPYMSPASRSKLKAKMAKIGLETAYYFQKRYPGIKELGLDIAIDRQGNPWILEVNTMPNLWLFCRLPNKKMFWRIIKNAKGYGRVK